LTEDEEDFDPQLLKKMEVFGPTPFEANVYCIFGRLCLC